MYRALGRYPEALDYLHRSLAVSRPNGHREAEGYALAYLGNVHGELDDLDEARRYGRAALAIATDTGIRPLQTLVHNALGDNAERGEPCPRHWPTTPGPSTWPAAPRNSTRNSAP